MPVGEQRLYRLRSLEGPLVITELEALAQEPPGPRPLQAGDLDDPKPWLEAYAAGLGSSLELRFLRLFEQHGFSLGSRSPSARRRASRPSRWPTSPCPSGALAQVFPGRGLEMSMPSRRGHRATGRVKLKLLPLPTSLSTEIRPPWASTNPLVMYNPSPTLPLEPSPSRIRW